ncbi:hypothetical protein ACEPAF_921 [Sanghuangporus sanghuang]
MTMATSSYWSSILSWLTSRTATGTNTSVGPNKSRASVQPTCINDKHKKDLDLLLAATLTEQPYSGTGSRSDSPRSEPFEYEYEMYDVGASTDVGSGKSLRERERSNGHGRSQSESASPSRPRADAQRERAYNTLPRSHAQKSRTHARSSSYAPVVVVPGVVNSSFLLFSPDVRGRNNNTSSVPVRRKMHTLATKSEFEKSKAGERQAAECASERRRGEGREFDGETSEEGSSSPRSRSSFDSFGSSDSDSQSSYTSYGTQSTTSCPDDERACTVSHRSPYTISDR